MHIAQYSKCVRTAGVSEQFRLKVEVEQTGFELSRACSRFPQVILTAEASDTFALC
jgi:hypothetical protein